MCKIAEAISNNQIIDNVLALKFANPTNIRMFVEMKPSIELTASRLAQLLTASRLGVRAVPEQETSTAMKNLAFVIEGLDMLEKSV